MVQQIHKRTDDESAKFILQQYVSRQLDPDKASEYLKIRKSRKRIKPKSERIVHEERL